MFQTNQKRKILNYVKSLCAKFRYFLIYILGQNVSKNQAKKILNYIKSSCIILCGKMFQYFYTIDAHLKHCSVKIGSTSFLSSSDMQKFHHLLGFYVIDIISSLNFF